MNEIPPVPPPPASPRGTPPPPSNTPGAQPREKKGLPPLAWVGIGCGALIIIGLVVALVGGFFFAKKVQDVAQDFEDNPVKATAELMVKANPEIDLVESNDDEGTMTILNKKTGELLTVDYADIKEGRIRWTTDEGEVSIDASEAASGEGGGVTVTTPEGTSRYGSGESVSLPNWVPDYPGSEPTSNLTTETGGMKMSVVGFKTTDSVNDVLEFYRGEMESRGMKILNYTTSSGEQGSGGVAMAEDSEKKHSINVLVTERNGECDVRIQYSEKL